MWTEQFEFMMTLMVMAALLRVSYELSRPRSSESRYPGELLPQTVAHQKEPVLTPEQREWADRAVRRYAESQEKKWRRWNEAMFERV